MDLGKSEGICKNFETGGLLNWRRHLDITKRC